MSELARTLPLVTLLTIAACDKASPASSRKDETPPQASVASVASVPSAGVVLDSSVPAVDAGASTDAAAGDAGGPPDTTVHLLLERVMKHDGQTRDRLLAFDLLVLVDVPRKPPVRIQPFCPPGRRDAFEICKGFRACQESDAGTDNAVVCDGKSFVLVQHDGATYLKTEETEIRVRPDTPAIVAPTRRDRLALGGVPSSVPARATRTRPA
jgi:hypothetical protein